MDTISRENSPSILPFVGFGLGIVAVILAGVALARLGSVKTLNADVEVMKEQVSSMSGDVGRVSKKADDASGSVASLTKSIQGAFDDVTLAINSLRADVNKLAAAKPAAAAAGTKPAGPAGPAAAPGPGGDYTIKSGDNLSKIARAHGVSLTALQNANPGVDSGRLNIGQKINLPK